MENLSVDIKELKGAVSLILTKLEEVLSRLGQVEQRLDRVEQRLDQVEGRLDRLEALFLEEQTLNASRYQELRSGLDYIQREMATKSELDRVFKALSEDIGVAYADDVAMRKRLNWLEKRVDRLEETH